MKWALFTATKNNRPSAGTSARPALSAGAVKALDPVGEKSSAVCRQTAAFCSRDPGYRDFPT